jgi:hypothetical protein
MLQLIMGTFDGEVLMDGYANVATNFGIAE